LSDEKRAFFISVVTKGGDLVNGLVRKSIKCFGVLRRNINADFSQNTGRRRIELSRFGIGGKGLNPIIAASGMFFHFHIKDGVKAARNETTEVYPLVC